MGPTVHLLDDTVTLPLDGKHELVDDLNLLGFELAKEHGLIFFHARGWVLKDVDFEIICVANFVGRARGPSAPGALDALLAVSSRTSSILSLSLRASTPPLVVTSAESFFCSGLTSWSNVAIMTSSLCPSLALKQERVAEERTSR